MAFRLLLSFALALLAAARVEPDVRQAFEQYIKARFMALGLSGREEVFFKILVW